MNMCPHCHSPITKDAPPTQCLNCGGALAVAREPKRADDSWEAPAAPSDDGDGSGKPIIGAKVEPDADGRKTTTGELLRGLLQIAAARTERRRSDRPPPMQPGASDEGGLSMDDVPGTRMYGSRALVVGPTAAAKAAVSLGPAHLVLNEAPPPDASVAAVPVPEDEDLFERDGLIPRALESLCDRVRAHTRGVACVIDLLTLVASADGVVDDAEIDAISSAVGVLLGGVRLPQYMDLLVRSSVDEIHKIGAAEAMLGIAEVLSECDAAEDGLVMAIAIAYASYGMCPPERATIRALAGVVNIDSDRCEDLIRRVRAEVDPAWEKVVAKPVRAARG